MKTPQLWFASLVVGAVLLFVNGAMAQPRCPGDVNGDDEVTVDEIISLVNCALNGCPVWFVDNGDGTVTDNWTGLMWEKKAGICLDGPSCSHPHDVRDRYTLCANVNPQHFECDTPPGTAYTVFLAQLNAGDGFAGYTDWRLPTIDELVTLLDVERDGRAIDPVFNNNCGPDCTVLECSCTAPACYWSSTTDENRACVVSFTTGVVFSDDPAFLWHVRAVRGGSLLFGNDAMAQPRCPGDVNGDDEVTVDEIISSVNRVLNGCPVRRLVDNGDGTVTDRDSGLMWEKKTGTYDHQTFGVICSETVCTDAHDVNNRHTWCLDAVAGMDIACDSPGNPPDGGAFSDFLARLNGHYVDPLSCFAGYCDWRLPTVEELQTILLEEEPYPGCFGGTTPWIDRVFGPTAPFPYWSATTNADDPDSAWFVAFHDPVVSDAVKVFPFHVRAVRGGL